MSVPTLFVFLIPAFVLVLLIVKLQIWIVKTAIKDALREYDQEKTHGP